MISEKQQPEHIILFDGRKIFFNEYGDREGTPVLYFHGFPNCRLEAGMIHSKAERIGVRIISIDRPGIGLSDFHQKRQIIDWPNDIIELADQLVIEKFSVLGVSAGAPYALACASKCSTRITTVGIVSALGSIEHKYSLRKDYIIAFKIAGVSLKAFQRILWLNRFRYIKKPDKAHIFTEKKMKELADCDRKIAQIQSVNDYIQKTQCEASIRGMKGLAYEAKLLGKPWNIKLEEISQDLDIIMWHGENDNISSYLATKAIGKRIPNCCVNYYPNEGHYSLIINKTNDILLKLR